MSLNARYENGECKTVAVTCNGLQGDFDPSTRVFYYPRRTRGRKSQVFTPTEFERHAGMAASKKWKYSVRIDLDAEPDIEYDVVALGPYTLGKWLEENGYDNRVGKGRSLPKAANMSKASQRSSQTNNNTNREQSEKSNGEPEAENMSKRVWLNPIHTKEEEQEDSEKYRITPTGPRVGADFQIEVPELIDLSQEYKSSVCKREGSIAFKNEQEALKSASREYDDANELPTCAIVDISDDDEVETLRERSSRRRRIPQWLQGSINPFSEPAKVAKGSSQSKQQGSNNGSKQASVQKEKGKNTGAQNGNGTLLAKKNGIVRANGKVKSKPAQSKGKVISLATAFRMARLEIRDDGTGFVVLETENGERYTGLVERAAHGTTKKHNKQISKKEKNSKAKILESNRQNGTQKTTLEAAANKTGTGVHSGQQKNIKFENGVENGKKRSLEAQNMEANGVAHQDPNVHSSNNQNGRSDTRHVGNGHKKVKSRPENPSQEQQKKAEEALANGTFPVPNMFPMPMVNGFPGLPVYNRPLFPPEQWAMYMNNSNTSNAAMPPMLPMNYALLHSGMPGPVNGKNPFNSNLFQGMGMLANAGYDQAAMRAAYEQVNKQFEVQN